MTEAGALPGGRQHDRVRAEGRRPRAVLLDVFETMLRVDALRTRFVDVGRPEHECDLFFTRTLRDGMALTLAGGVRPFADVARAALRQTTGHTLSDPALDHVMDGFRELPPQEDAEPALMALARARIPVYALTNGSVAVASDSLDAAGLRTYLRGLMSTEQIHSFKPPGRVYHWACQQIDVPADRTALIAVHWWDVHGAIRAGLVGALATRLEGRVPDVSARPHVVGERLDDVVKHLLDLPN
jgi:2-haloacid dehalogenase